MNPAPVLHGEHTLASVTDRVSAQVLARPAGRVWLLAFALALALTALLGSGIALLLVKGVGIWGIDMPVAWGFAITDYVWWIGIGMAGTFISAALYLTRQDWRTSLNRYAEAMTVFAVSVSGLFPILHLGRPWFFYWLAPYPNRMGTWPQWRSSLLWDFFAILAYLIVSILYFYTGLLPDFAALRDRARSRRSQVLYGLLAMGWRGEARHWHRYETLTLLLAGLAVPLVFSVHSMVALDFSEGLLPGWHSGIFPPFFVLGALFSGFAMVIVLGLPLRHFFGLADFITERHLDNLAKMMLAAGLFVGYSYLNEIFVAFYGGDRYEIALTLHRFHGAYAWVFWTTIFCNVVVIQALWSARVRAHHGALFAIALLVLAGMWLERFMLIVTSLYRDFLPSSWGMFYPTFWDLAFLAGSIGLFLALFLLFVRWLPVLPIVELRRLVVREQEQRS
jgi:Ni/Fe-hydrogenase subunit HybB-like protein